MASDATRQGFDWTNRRRQVQVTLAFCRAVYLAVLVLTGIAFLGFTAPSPDAWAGLAAILTANSAVYISVLPSYLFGPAFENRALAARGSQP